MATSQLIKALGGQVIVINPVKEVGLVEAAGALEVATVAGLLKRS